MSATNRADRRVPGHDPISRFVATLVDRAICTLPILEPSRRFAEMIARFAGVGGISSALYAIVVAIAVSCVHVHHELATVIAFAFVTPVNFTMHRAFTFHSRGVLRQDVLRYLLLQLTSFIVCLTMMAVCVDVLGLPYPVGIVGAVILVPVVSFLVMDRWVFAKKAI